MKIHILALTILVCSVSFAWPDSPASGPLGKKVADFSLRDFRGQQVSLSDFKQDVLVVAFLGTECPLAKLYSKRLVELAEQYAEQGVGVLGINSNSQDSLTEIAAQVRVQEINFPMLKDAGSQVADSVGAERTPQVFLLDRQRVVRYCGRIDDQYGVGTIREEPQRRDLQIAIDELLAGQPISVPSTRSVGCIIGRKRVASETSDITYSNQISRLLQRRCIECHRAGEIAPFALTDYSEVAGWSEMIEEVVRQERMPPWHASPKHGSFSNDRRLSDEEKQLIYQWVAAGAPEGEVTELPEPRHWQEGWQLPRTPDYIANIADEPFEVPAEGAVRYQYFQMDPGFTEDKWVDAIEIQPGNRSVVHHVLMFAGTDEDVRRVSGGGAHGYDGIYVPGQRVEPYPTGMARKIPAGSRLTFQVHYTPVGSLELDQTRVGMTFVDRTSVKFEVRTASAVNPELRIPPNDPDYRLEAISPRLPEGALLLALNPHMHLRGKSFFYEAVLPDKSRQTLLDVPHYDFNWQTAYRLSEPLPLPAGTKIHCVAHFDNSADNLNNPNPNETVRWGEQTWDEMMIGYLDYAVPIGTAMSVSSHPQIEAMFNNFDKDFDDFVTIEEIPGRFRLMLGPLDTNGDGKLSLEEFESASKLLGNRRKGPANE